MSSWRRALRSATAGPAVLLAVLALAAAACAPAPPASRADDTRTVLLLSCRTFAGSTRAAQVLDDLASATDTFGDTRFRIESPPQCRPGDLPGLLARHRDADVAIVIVGDLSVLDGVDPSRPPAAKPRLTSRIVPEVALRDVLARLERTASAQGTRLLLATAPLSRQALIEVPELIGVADIVRERAGHFDLAASFATLEPAPLFANALDLLDDYGHDALARILFQLSLREDGPFPARDEAERAARLQARALAAFHADQREEFQALAAEALGEPIPHDGLASGVTMAATEPADAADTATDGHAPAGEPAPSATVTPADAPRHAARAAARLAAIASARDGLAVAVPRWQAIEGPAAGVPGLALGRMLLRGPLPAASAEPAPPPPDTSTAPGDAFEAQLVASLDEMWRQDGSAPAAALRCVEEHPERMTAWILLQVVSLSLSPQRDVRGEARRHMLLCPASAPAEPLITRIFRTWPMPVDVLPALLLAERPFAGMLPSGPVLETARRRAALGYVDHALELLREALRDLRAPPSWSRESLRIDALPRG